MRFFSGAANKSKKPCTDRKEVTPHPASFVPHLMQGFIARTLIDSIVNKVL